MQVSLAVDPEKQNLFSMKELKAKRTRKGIPYFGENSRTTLSKSYHMRETKQNVVEKKHKKGGKED